ncbi:MAG: helix-turn-helix domain-containing protein [Actinomycetota bacterium]|nr:helix-turn-helix domain-containing protein [Actinomycetota bacterium]
MFEAVAVELAGMPEAVVLRRSSVNGHSVVSFGTRLVFCYDDDDIGMRNLAVVALTDAGVPGLEVAKVFDLSAPYVSRLRGRARASGAAGLVRRNGRPSKLSDRQMASVRRLAARGVSQAEIARRFGMARSSVCEMLAKFGSLAVQEPLTPSESASGEPTDDAQVEDVPADDAPASRPGPRSAVVEPERVAPGGKDLVAGLARIAAGDHRSRYAGAALLYPYLDMVGATEVFQTLRGGPARRYDDLSVLATALFGFALGSDTVEGAKHLRRADAGALVGVAAIPELSTLRNRLCALADGSDPLALQRAFATAMLRGDPPLSWLYYVDDHFVAYTGAKPVAKGWNTKRRHAQRGRDDTVVSDDRGRAVVFASGEPSGLASTMRSVLGQLAEVVGADKPIMLGFDRGGSYPVAFNACQAAGMGWITYRRGKLAPVGVTVKRSWCRRGEVRKVVHVADEVVNVSGYGEARQLTLFERGAAVLQVLTSDMGSPGAALLCWLRSRWTIENLFKYAEAHNGIDSIASYGMDLVSDDRLVDNPARKQARAVVAAGEEVLAGAERAMAQMLCDPDLSAEAKRAATSDRKRAVEEAKVALTTARGALKPIPAKVKATDLDPDAKRAKMRLERRGLQMVLRLLAFDAESWTAEHFDAYLQDPDEYRAILRHLLRLGGSFSYERGSITVTLDRPDSPRVARALELLAEELSARGACLLGDRRPLRYEVAKDGRN